jgi:hypothetical protein
MEKKRGRPPGSPNKYPSREKVLDELQRRNFDIFDERIALYKECRSRGENDIADRILADLFTYCFPRRRPESADGEVQECGPVAQFTDEQLIKLAEHVRSNLALTANQLSSAHAKI